MGPVALEPDRPHRVVLSAKPELFKKPLRGTITLIGRRHHATQLKRLEDVLEQGVHRFCGDPLLLMRAASPRQR